jgi:hypothetical protein
MQACRNSNKGLYKCSGPSVSAIGDYWQRTLTACSAKVPRSYTEIARSEYPGERKRPLGTTGLGAEIHNTSESCDNQGVASADDASLDGSRGAFRASYSLQVKGHGGGPSEQR